MLKIKSKYLNLKERTLRKISKTAKNPKHHCNICDHSFGAFLPYTFDGKVLRKRIKRVNEMGIIASPQDAFFCPYCYSTSRDRHFTAMFKKINFINTYLNEGTKALHFAPENGISKLFIERKCEYHPVDLDMEKYKDFPNISKVDITDIPFEDNTFDIIYCVHVLEHIPDDKKALSELFRVLKPGATALLQTPHSDKLKETFVDPTVKTREQEMDVYVEEGHVRIYGLDLMKRYTDAGFELNFVKSTDLFTEEDAKKLGFNNREDLMLVKKPL